MKYPKNRKTIKKTGGKKKPRGTKRQNKRKSKVGYLYRQQLASQKQQLRMQQEEQLRMQQQQQQQQQPSTSGNLKQGLALGFGVGVGDAVAQEIFEG